MADQVLKGGLILTDWVDDMAKQQANQYLQVQRQQQQQEYAKAQALEATTNQARQQYAGGNVAGAKSVAAAGNAWGAWDTIDTAQKAQVAAQATDIGGAAYNLTRLPKGQARVDYFNAFVPTLKSHGMTDQEISQYANSGFLDNDDALHGYADKAVGIKELWKADQERQKASYDRETDLMKPTTAADGAVLTRGADGSYTPVYLPGSKPMQQIIKNEDGSSSYVNIPGTAGTSYAPGTGDKSRLMNYEARGKGFGAVPDTVQNLGQFSDYATSLNRQGVKSSAAGDFQIVGDTMRRYAPKVLGPDWRNQPFNSATQDRVAEGIFVDNRGSAAALRKQWVSLSMAEAERIRHLPWAQARLAILAGESGGGSAPQGAGPRPAGNGIETVNLGGGRTGPLWKDETSNIGGQPVYGQRNQQTGEFKVLGGGANRAAKPATQEEQLAALYANRMEEANNGLQSLYERGYKAHSADADKQNRLGNIPLVGNYLMSSDAQEERQYETNFLTAILRKESGASISPTEFATGAANYFPRPGDSPAVLARKSQARTTAIKGIRAASGRASAGQTSSAPTKTVNGRTYVKVQGGWKAQ